MLKMLLMKKRYANGEVIFREGEPGSEAILIREGYVSIWKQDGEKRVELATRGPGEILGEMALLDDSPRSASISARGEVEAEVITRSDLTRMMESTPEPLVKIVEQLLVRLRDANEMTAMYAPEYT